MLSSIEFVFCSLCVVASSMYIWNKFNDNKINFSDIKNILICIICSILITLNYFYVKNYIKPITSTIIMIFTFCALYKDNIKKSIILPIYSQIIMLIAELIYVSLILFFAQINEVVLEEQYFGNIITNIIIALLSIAIACQKISQLVYIKIILITEKIRVRSILFFSLFLIIIAGLLVSIVYYKVNVLVLLIINTVIIFIYTIIIYFYLKTNNNYLKVYDKYNMTLNSLKEYEDILSRYRISNHENKNQLLTIRSMVKNKKVVSYIDEIVENKIKDNEKLMFDSMVIPEGGLRGLIYSKMLLMKENNIEFDLCVDKALKTTDLTVISDDLMFNICSIIGVYLDNAIEAVKELKEKYITIEIYLDDTLNIAITNNYEGNIDLDSIDKVGYSTKGGSHGYGLSLVKEIISNNKSIKSNRSISDDEFTQEISVKYKK